MGEIAQQFVAKFHNLKGATIGEKTRSFFKLLKSIEPSKSCIDAVTAQLTPQTYLERIFYAEFLIYHRRFDELHQAFLREDGMVVRKVAKQAWFFRQFSKTIGADFVTQFLPTVSYSLRLKILKKTPVFLEEGKCDELFDALLDHYGLCIATNVLTSCSDAKIAQTLKTQPVELRTRQQKQLFAKSRDLFLLHLKELVKHKGQDFLHGNPIFKFVAGRDPEMFVDLKEEYKLKFCRIGKRTTRKLVRAQRDRIVAKPELYEANLNKAHFVRNLAPDFHRIYAKLFPETIGRALYYYNNEADSLLERYPRKRRFELFRNTFNRTFHEELQAHHVDERFVKMIVDSTEREKWARMKLEQENNDLYLKYFKTETCLEAMTQRFDQVGKREEKISILIQNAIINNDLDHLLYVCDRFKNDHETTHANFLKSLTRNSSVFDQLDQKHWNYVKEVISRPEFRNGSVLNTDPIHVRYLEFLFRNHQALEEEVIEWSNIPSWLNSLYNLYKTNPKSERAILLILLKLAPERTGRVVCRVILECKKYNSRNPASKIDLFQHPRLVESVKSAIIGEQIVHNIHDLASMAEYMVCTKDTNPSIIELTRLYWENFQRVAKISAIKWFLRHRPDLVAENVDKLIHATIIDSVFDCYDNETIPDIWKIVKSYTHLAIDQKVIEFCKNKLSDPGFAAKSNLVTPLAILMPPQDYIKLVEAYKPTDEDTNQIQKQLLRNLVHVKEPELAMPVIMQFYKSGYVASCLTPLYSSIRRMPQNRAKAFLDQMRKCEGVAAKKYALYSVCLIFDNATVLNALKSSHLTQAIAVSYQHFVKNPSQEAFEIFKSKLLKHEKANEFTNSILVNTPAPHQYKSRCFESVFEVFHKQGNKFTEALLYKFLQNESVGQLTRRFFESVKHEFMTLYRSDLIFAYYIIYSEEGDKLDIIFETLRSFREENWTFRGQDARAKLQEFVITFFNVYMEWEGDDHNLLDSFLARFHEIFRPVEAFEEFVIISFAKCKNRSVASIAKIASDLNNNFITTFGKLTIRPLANCLNKYVLPKICKKEANIYEFYRSFLLFKHNVDDMILLIRLLPQKVPELKESARFYYETLETLKQIENETVKVHLNFLFKERI